MRRIWLAAAMTVLAGWLVVDTRWGVFLVFDVLGDLGADELVLDADAAPLRAPTPTLAATRRALPPEIRQPSGIVVDEASGHLLVTTDQAELFELDPELRIISQRRLARGPLLLRQGSVEAVSSSAAEPGQWIVAGEGTPRQVLRAAGSWVVRSPWDGWEPPPGEVEIAGLTAASDAYYAVENDDPVVHEFDVDGRHRETWRPELPEERRGSLDGLCFSGVAAAGSHLYIVSQNFSLLLVVDVDERLVVEVLRLPEVGEYSDLAVHRGGSGELSLLLVVDHDLFEEIPPLVEIELTQHLVASASP